MRTEGRGNDATPIVERRKGKVKRTAGSYLLGGLGNAEAGKTEDRGPRALRVFGQITEDVNLYFTAMFLYDLFGEI